MHLDISPATANQQKTSWALSLSISEELADNIFANIRKNLNFEKYEILDHLQLVSEIIKNTFSGQNFVKLRENIHPTLLAEAMGNPR